VSYATEVAADSPALWWKLDEASGTVANDSSGNGHNSGSCNVTFGVADCPAGMSQTCASFNGTTQTVIETSYVPSLTAFTFETWVNLNSQNVWGPCYGPASGNPDYDHVGFLLQSTGNENATPPRISVGNGTVTVTVTAPSNLPSSGWAHLAVTWDGSTVTLYVNGASVGTPATLTGTVTTAANGIHVGDRYNGASFYKGNECQAAFYTTWGEPCWAGPPWWWGGPPPGLGRRWCRWGWRRRRWFTPVPPPGWLVVPGAG
jgi:Concanavalin A-like lectin/glucanases superfamily